MQDSRGNLERILFITIICLLLFWNFSSSSSSSSSFSPLSPSTQQVIQQAERSSTSSSSDTRDNNKEVTDSHHHQQCPPCSVDDPSIKKDNNKLSSSSSPPNSDLEHSLAVQHKDDPQLRASSPIGHASFIHPSFQNFKFSSLLKTIDVETRSKDGTYYSLGVFTKDGRVDQPYFDCRPTTETADDEVFFGGRSSNVNKKKGSSSFTGRSSATTVVIKSNPISETCMTKIERLNPRVPLREVPPSKEGVFVLKQETQKCAQNKRRFSPLQSKLHAAAIDDKEIERRKAKETRFLAAQCPELVPSSSSSSSSSGRKIFIDLGARHYLSSAQWFRDHYPGGRDFIIHGFDVVSKWAHSFQFDKKASFHTAAVWNETGYVSFILSKDTFGGFFHQNFFDAPLDQGRLLTVPAVALSEALKFLVTKEDFVVVKMDVEGTEWTLLQHLAQTGGFDFIDEMFIECHHGEFVPKWPTAHSLADCHRMFNSLRKIGIYAHEWY